MECNHTSLESWWEYDQMGIELARVCDRCIKDRLGKFNPAVLTDEQQDLLDVSSTGTYREAVEEQIDED